LEMPWAARAPAETQPAGLCVEAAEGVLAGVELALGTPLELCRGHGGSGGHARRQGERGLTRFRA